MTFPQPVQYDSEREAIEAALTELSGNGSKAHLVCRGAVEFIRDHLARVRAAPAPSPADGAVVFLRDIFEAFDAWDNATKTMTGTLTVIDLRQKHLTALYRARAFLAARTEAKP